MQTEIDFGVTKWCLRVMASNQVQPVTQVLWYRLYLGKQMGLSWKNLSTETLAEAVDLSSDDIRGRLGTLESLGLIKISGTREKYNIRMRSKVRGAGIQLISDDSGGKPPSVDRNSGGKPPSVDRNSGGKPPSVDRNSGGKPPSVDRNSGGKPPSVDRNSGGKPPSVGYNNNTLLGSSFPKKRKRGRGSSSMPPSEVKSYWQKLSNLLRDITKDVIGVCYWDHKKAAKWQKQFRLLHEEDGVASKVIRQTLEWYGIQRKAGNTELPSCTSARGFRVCFGWISEMKQAAGSIDLSSLEPRWIAEAKLILETTELGDMRLECNGLARLLQSVCRWQERMVEVVQDLVRRQTTTDKDGFTELAPEVDGVRPDILWDLLDAQSDGTNLSALLVDYLTIRVQGNKHWDGNLTRYLPAQKEFDEFLQRRSNDLNRRWLRAGELDLCHRVANEATED